MSTEKTVVTVTIAGENYSIRSEATPDYTKECARYVDATITEIARASRSVIEPHKAAILAALSLADQLFQSRQAMETLQARVRSSAEELSAKIEAKLTDVATTIQVQVHK